MSKFCTNCGAPLDDNQKFCTSCGAQIGVPGTGTNPQVQSQPTYNGTTEAKSKVAAGILGILLGSFGIHNFYLGYNGKAIAQLLITLLTCGFGAFITSIWGLVEGILILTGSINVDANGVPLKD